MKTPFRVGQGCDVHALVAGRPLILGGVTIPYHLGLLGHSDADALLHATEKSVKDLGDKVSGEERAAIEAHLAKCEAAGLPSRFVIDDREQWRFVRVPLLGDVPYPVQMEPNLVVEFYSR